jgi:hypothetical protein
VLEDRVVNTIVKNHDRFYSSVTSTTNSKQSSHFQCETRVSDQEGEQSPTGSEKRMHMYVDMAAPHTTSVVHDRKSRYLLELEFLLIVACSTTILINYQIFLFKLISCKHFNLVDYFYRLVSSPKL